MGLFSWLTGNSAKEIKLKQDISKYLVFPYYPKKNMIWLNKKVSVPEETEICFCARNKVLDFLPTGEHILGALIIPNCSRKYKLYKVDRNNRAPINFKSYAYFINKKVIDDFSFDTSKLRFRNEVDGRFWVKINFKISFQVVNGLKLMQHLLNEFAYLKQFESEKIMNRWLSEFVSNELSKDQHRRAEFVEHIDELKELISAKLEHNLTSVGMKFYALNIPNVVISKHKTKNKLFISQKEETLTKPSIDDLSNTNNNLTAKPETIEGTEKFINMFSKPETIKKFEEPKKEIIEQTTEKPITKKQWKGLENFWD